MVFKQGGIFPIMPWFLNRGHSEKQYSHNAMVFKQGGILPRMPWFLKNSLKTLLSQRKLVKPCNNVKIPPFSSGHWNRCRPRASKTALGPRATLCGPRAVLEALGRHLFQSPSEKGRILAQSKRINLWLSKKSNTHATEPSSLLLWNSRKDEGECRK